MKNNIITLLLLLVIITGFSQNSGFEYTGRFTPAIKKATLSNANSVTEIMPQFGRYFILPFNLNSEFDKRRIEILPQKYFYPQENYNYMIDFIAFEISASCKGKDLTSKSTGEALTQEQKSILNTVDMGSDIRIKISFKFKNQPNDSNVNDNKIIEGDYVVTVIPETEAEYPGGYKQLTEYLNENVFSKISETPTSEKIQQAILRFTVNEDGQTVDARIAKSTTYPKIDELLLDAANKMPKWTPAENSKGIKVKQEFSIPLGGGGC